MYNDMIRYILYLLLYKILCYTIPYYDLVYYTISLLNIVMKYDLL